MDRRRFLQWLLASVPAAAGAIYVPKIVVPVAKIKEPTHEDHIRAHIAFREEVGRVVEAHWETIRKATELDLFFKDLYLRGAAELAPFAFPASGRV